MASESPLCLWVKISEYLLPLLYDRVDKWTTSPMAVSYYLSCWSFYIFQMLPDFGRHSHLCPSPQFLTIPHLSDEHICGIPWIMCGTPRAVQWLRKVFLTIRESAVLFHYIYGSTAAVSLAGVLVLPSQEHFKLEAVKNWVLIPKKWKDLFPFLFLS